MKRREILVVVVVVVVNGRESFVFLEYSVYLLMSFYSGLRR
jgi:hypothetical protein